MRPREPPITGDRAKKKDYRCSGNPDLTDCVSHYNNYTYYSKSDTKAQ